MMYLTLASSAMLALFPLVVPPVMHGIHAVASWPGIPSLTPVSGAGAGLIDRVLA